MLGIHCCPMLQKVYQKGAVLVKEECQHNLSCTCVDGLGFFLMVVTLDASTGDFVVSILVQKLTCGVILLHDNARPHTANTITVLLQKFKWEVLSHPPYSADLSPCDYAIFGPLKKGSERQTIHLGRRR